MKVLAIVELKVITQAANCIRHMAVVFQIVG